MRTNQKVWDEFNGGFVSPIIALANAYKNRDLQMSLCRKYPSNLKWMGGYIKEVQE